jgi:CHAT domain-containing protein
MRALYLLAFLLLPSASASAQDVAAIRASANQKFQARDYAGAIQEYQRALDALPAMQDSAEGGDLLLDLYRALYYKADYPGAQARAHQALEIYQRVYGQQHASVARALDAVAVATSAAGDYHAANPWFEQALAVAQKTPGAEHPDTIGIMQRYAKNLARAGEYARAKVLEQQTLAIAERRLGPDDTIIADTLNGLSQILVEMGDYPSAQQCARRALGIMEHRTGKDSEQVADTLIGMGNDARDAADYLNGKAYFERAAAIYKTLLGPESTRVGGALDNLGQTLVEMKRFTEAQPILERSLVIQRKALGARHPWTANVLQSLGKLEAGLGNYEKARDFYRQNLAIWREVLGPEHPFTVTSMTQIGDILGHLGQYPEALDMALQAADIRRDNIVRTVRTVDERQALRYATVHNTSMDTALTIASRPQASAQDREKAWDALIRSRALVLDEMGARHRSIRDSGDTEVGDLVQRVASARNQITKLVLQGPGKLSLPNYSSVLEAARSEWEEAGTQLAVKSADFRHEWTQQRAGYTDIKAALPAGSALVAFRRYRRKNYQVAGDSFTDSYLAFVLAGRNREPAVIRLGGAAQIESLVTQWRNEIDRERGSLGRSAENNEARYRVAATALRQAVWDPVQRRLGSVGHVYIVPDGALQLVNFDSLPSPDGRYLVESGPLLHVLSTERDLAAPTPPPSGTDLLVVADPQFQAKPGTLATTASLRAAYRGAPSTCSDFASLQFGSLPGSLAEAQTILRIWNGQGWHAVALSGNDASEGALKGMAAGKRVVHIATHGFFLDAQCPGNAVARENPLLRSGLALAGANRRQSAGADEDDGILTAEEAAALDLENTEWVVLSGCDTGVGDVKAGEGVLGLRRAFQEAGARTLIASLWPVDDSEARLWMGTLYRARFHDGKGTAESVREADLGQLRARRKAAKSTHPFYWAGFVAVGDWR